jgi:transposase InsO family protein
MIAFESGLFSMSELCNEYGISRKTGYKWLGRYEEAGMRGLQDLKRAPHTFPHQTPEEVCAVVRAARKRHPHWGPRKLLHHLSERPPRELREILESGGRLPAASTAGDILKRAGLVEPRKRRPRPPHPGTEAIADVAPNDVWSADFKGEFRTRDHKWCYPLTISDASSRYLLACEGLTSVEHDGARDVFEQLFRHSGLPVAIRSDNGCPFCSQAIGGLSRLSVWWMKLGIVHQRITPGKPQQNGRHERMHRTLKSETARPPAADLRRQQERFVAFRQEYNELRPHEAIAMQTPASLWAPSSRTMPDRTPEPEYPGHMEVRTVSKSGEIKFLGYFPFVSMVLAHERIALEEVDDGIWSLFFCNTLLGRIDQRKMRLIQVKPTH